jgi:hypothetical protein
VATATASALIPQGRSALMPLALGARAVTTLGGVIWIGRVVHLLYAEPGSTQYLVAGAAGLAVFAALAAGSLKIAEFAAQMAHASPRRISQPISQAAPTAADGHRFQNIPTVSQS